MFKVISLSRNIFLLVRLEFANSSILAANDMIGCGGDLQQIRIL